MTVFVTNIGTEHHRELKRYKTASSAKKWARGKLGDFKEWCDRYNVALGVKVQQGSKEIDELNIASLPPGRHHSREWRFRDDHTGFTLVVELWTEEGVGGG